MAQDRAGWRARVAALMYMYLVTQSEQVSGQTDRQTDRQIGGQTERPRNIYMSIVKFKNFFYQVLLYHTKCCC